MNPPPFPLPFLLDGAYFSNLVAMGMPTNGCVEQWLCDNPAALQKLQQDFLQAGAQALCTPTPEASAFHLSLYGLEDKVEEINTRLFNITKQNAQAAGVPVIGTLGPSGRFIPPFGESDFDSLYDQYRAQIRVLEENGADGFLLQDQTSLADMRAAVLAARTTDLPIFVTLAVDASGHTVTGCSLLPCLITLQAMGVEAVGLSGTLSPEEMLPFFEDILPHTQIPLLAQPNIRHPRGQDYLPPRQFAQEMKALLQTGVSILGGSEGVSPAHVAQLKQQIAGIPLPPFLPEEADCYAASTETQVFFLRDTLEFSEPLECSINLGEDLIDLDDEQSNVALVEIHSVDDALLLAEQGHMSRLPLAVQAESLPVLDAALRYFQGRLIVSSDCLIEREHIEARAAKYGAIVY